MANSEQRVANSDWRIVTWRVGLLPDRKFRHGRRLTTGKTEVR
ncbi:hypothetical protein Q2T83_01450 [Fervidibacter sacchari]|uniref:Uncharacterized protein n=1 Tax=Candidatus Fervidibacter sacchari TaxID=1448929 RepID=A0ABT2ET64_9BACT|nr:hypothetical protein [Candidatus Fervidibacter sacchari]MCS3921151.1 hypothetical protein [Candidatus Fervidibacter sacchari]WKU16502.1 hypothetical protein Q2T83_01450 [Candidatus Fervidibacter sacchari]